MRVKGDCGYCLAGRAWRWGVNGEEPCPKCANASVIETDVAKLAPNMKGVLVALLEAEDAHGGEHAWYPLSANEIAHAMNVPMAGYGKGAGNWVRRMAPATRVTPAITALRLRGLIGMTRRRDGLSGTADVLTEAGRDAARWVREAVQEQEALARGQDVGDFAPNVEC